MMFSRLASVCSVQVVASGRRIGQGAGQYIGRNEWLSLGETGAGPTVGVRQPA